MLFWRFVKALFGRFPLNLSVVISLLLLVSVVDASSILSIVPVVDILTKSSPDQLSGVTTKLMGIMRSAGLPTTTLAFMLVFLALTFLKSLITVASIYVSERMRLNVIRHLIEDTYEAFWKASWGFFARNNSAKLANTLLRESQVVFSAVDHVVEIIVSILRVMFYLSIALYMSWKLFLVVAGLMACVLSPLFLLGRLSYRLGRKSTDIANRYHKLLMESLLAAKLIIGYAKQDEVTKDLKTHVRHHQENDLVVKLLAKIINPLMEPFGLAVIVFVFYLATEKFRFPLSEVVVLFYSLRVAVPLSTRLIMQRNEVNAYLPAWEQIVSLQKQALASHESVAGRAAPKFESRIEARGLSFAYGAGPPILKDVQLEIPRKGMVGLAGASGSGKSTLIDLLMGLQKPVSGKILVDGQDLASLDLGRWREIIGYVPQDVFLFDGSLRDNLLWANPRAGEGDIEEACRLANAQSFIRDLPQGLESPVGDRGVSLSGGQKQRIALARAMLRKPSLMILDEATSALDSESERLIQQSIEAVAAHAAVVVVAHRLSTLRDARTIYFLRDGQVLEQGTFSELLGKKGEFYRLARLQGIEEGG